MQYCTYTPALSLAKYIKYYWTLDANDAMGGSRDRIFPDGCMELIFHHGDVFRKYFNEFDACDQPVSFVHGQLKRYIEIESTGKIGIFSIRFQPDGLRPFLNINIDDLTGNAVAVADLWGADGLMLEEQMLEACSTAQRINIIESFLIRQLKWPDDGLIRYCVRSIIDSSGEKPIENLAREVNLGRRHLERRFVASVGLSPKLLTRIVRFQNTLFRIKESQSVSLTGVAYRCGFYDQSHFIKDFKEFSGLNPRQYFKADLEFARFLTSG